MRNSKQRGFTLIEMLVVIVVIGILATIVLVSVASGRKKAQATKSKTDMVEFSKAFEMAASEGCRVIHLTANGELACTSPAALNNKIYATISAAAPGVTYSVTLEKGTATLVGNATWGTPTATDSSSINKGYTFIASGFTNSDTFTCSDGGGLGGATKSGCYCSATDGCSTVN